MVRVAREHGVVIWVEAAAMHKGVATARVALPRVGIAAADGTARETAAPVEITRLVEATAKAVDGLRQPVRLPLLQGTDVLTVLAKPFPADLPQLFARFDIKTPVPGGFAGDLVKAATVLLAEAHLPRARNKELEEIVAMLALGHGDYRKAIDERYHLVRQPTNLDNIAYRTVPEVNRYLERHYGREKLLSGAVIWDLLADDIDGKGTHGTAATLKIDRVATMAASIDAGGIGLEAAMGHATLDRLQWISQGARRIAGISMPDHGNDAQSLWRFLGMPGHLHADEEEVFEAMAQRVLVGNSALPPIADDPSGDLAFDQGLLIQSFKVRYGDDVFIHLERLAAMEPVSRIVAQEHNAWLLKDRELYDWYKGRAMEKYGEIASGGLFLKLSILGLISTVLASLRVLNQRKISAAEAELARRGLTTLSGRTVNQTIEALNW